MDEGNDGQIDVLVNQMPKMQSSTRMIFVNTMNILLKSLVHSPIHANLEKKSLQFWLMINEIMILEEILRKRVEELAKKKYPLKLPLNSCVDFTSSLSFTENPRSNICFCYTIYAASITYFLEHFSKHCQVNAGFHFKFIVYGKCKK